MSDTFELTPHSGGYYQGYEAYWANGSPQTNLSGLANWVFAPDGEGSLFYVADSSGQRPLTRAYYIPFGATALTLGAGDTDGFRYDANAGRETQCTELDSESSQANVLALCHKPMKAAYGG